MLSKSRILASLQCLKRVHLEVNRPELARYSPRAEAAFATGHAVGALARRLYDDGGGRLIEYPGGSLAPALRQTQELLSGGFSSPIFEATLQHDGVLIRADVLLPAPDAGRGDGVGNHAAGGGTGEGLGNHAADGGTGEGGGNHAAGSGTGEGVEVREPTAARDGPRSWRIVEVKASTQFKPEHVHDCAVQAWVYTGAGYPLDGIALAHVNREFVYPGEGRYKGLLIEHDVTEQVLPLLDEVPRWVAAARQAAAGPLPEVAVGGHCTKPYECPFMHHCWPGEARYPVTGLGGTRKQLGLWVMRGYRDIRDVPAAEISGEKQLRIHRVTRSGRPELLPGARALVNALPFPRFYLDFETVGPAIPLWPGTRPYQALPFQWSCHVETGPGVLEHREFLDLSGDPPMRPLVEALIATLTDAFGPDGPVLVYTGFEAQVLGTLAERLPDLAPDLAAIRARLVDLHVVTKQHYYHPDMLGSWSIKSVLPTIAPDLDYGALDGIHEGTQAAAAYVEAIAPDTPGERRDEIRAQLLQYCRLDTEAMVRLLHFFAAPREAKSEANPEATPEGPGQDA